MNIWNRIKTQLNERLRGKYTGTAEKESRIEKQIDKNKSVNISSPSSQREVNLQMTMTNPNAKSKNTETFDDKFTANVPSTAIQNIHYDPKTERADVTFTNGKHSYEYKVSPEEMKDFLEAPSKGHLVGSTWNNNPHFRAPGY